MFNFRNTQDSKQLQKTSIIFVSGHRKQNAVKRPQLF
jgi:hypothetical protein